MRNYCSCAGENCSRYAYLRFADVSKLLSSPVHEYRFTALEILLFQYQAGDQRTKQQVFDFYLKHTRSFNSWDLVDTSARYIVGEQLLWRSRKLLYRLAKSSALWERRMAIVATPAFIQRGDLDDTFQISRLQLHDHKAVGWMLREAGKRPEPALLDFLRMTCEKASWLLLAGFVPRTRTVRLAAPRPKPFASTPKRENDPMKGKRKSGC